MSTTANLSEATEATKTGIEEYPSPAIVRDQALLEDWIQERDKFQKDPDAFWGDVA